MKRFVTFSVLFGILVGLACFCAGCNVTRVVTNESKYTTRGDTAVVITTKTIETYDARKHTTL